MSSSDEIRGDELEGFEDPLFARGKKETRSTKQTRSGPNSTIIVVLVALAVALSLLGYYLFQTQQKV
ncbi:MAG: hypothetical protein V3T61_10525, partial [Acidobacteriota bacterium]